jgi:hypothetical protein
MAGEAWRSHIPEEKTDGDLRNERWAAEAGSEVTGWLLVSIVILVAVGIGIAVGCSR